MKKVLKALLRGIAAVVLFLLTFALLLYASWAVVSGMAERHFRPEHGARVTSVAFSPDGRMLASASGDERLQLWRTDTGRSLRSLEGHKGWVMSAAFSPDGTLVASGGEDTTIRLWRAKDGLVVGTLTNHTGAVASVAFSPDGSLLASGSGALDSNVRLWRVADGAFLRVLTGHQGSVTAVSFSPDGRTLVSASVDRTLKVWRPTDGTLLWTTRGSYPPWMREGFVYAESQPFLVLLVLSVLFPVLMVIGIFRFGRQLLSRRKGAPAVAPSSQFPSELVDLLIL